MFVQLALGTFLICVSVVVMVSFIAIAMRLLGQLDDWFHKGNRSGRLILALAGIALWLVLALTVAVWLWAGVFLGLGLFESLEGALYFSVVAFTTLGFGDVILPHDWRLLSGLVAANGLILFSLSTAFLIETLREIAKAQEERR